MRLLACLTWFLLLLDFMGTFVRVYTSKRVFTWSELAALGVNFAWNRAVTIEGVMVTALLPYTSMDDLVSGRGPMAMGTSWRVAKSNTVDIRLPGGFKPAALTARPTIFRPEHPRCVPTCASSDDSAIGVDDLRSSMANTRVTVRGHLVCGGSRACVEGGCITGWVMVEAGKPRDGLMLQRAEDISPLEDHAGLCDSPNHPDIEVRATGLLLSNRRGPASQKGQPEGPQFLLDQATFCAIPSTAKP
jgi:hypothetical protein